jgi:hypothetical protein
MITVMFAYLVWILLTLAGMGYVFHILHKDQHRPVRIPIRRDE